MKENLIQQAAYQYCERPAHCEQLGAGLIHRTYKVEFGQEGSCRSIVLQCVNQRTFPQPEKIIRNYHLLSEFLSGSTEVQIPALVLTRAGAPFWIDEEGNFWRATEYIADSYAPAFASGTEEAYAAARRFADFTRALKGLEIQRLEIIIPGFHDLAARYRQFLAALENASEKRKIKGSEIIAQLLERENLVQYYNSLPANPAYPLRVMHHDCKISNMLFRTGSGTPICPVDLDTVMPGLFFSDLGDMIRSMACSVDENCTDFDLIEVRSDYYRAILNGYLEGMGDQLTKEETRHIHHAGLIIIYMQALRFMADYLNNDIYYKTTYPEQNYDRALNQLILLKKLEAFLQAAYHYSA